MENRISSCMSNTPLREFKRISDLRIKLSIATPGGGGGSNFGAVESY
jgi:hypothetical protein